MIKIRMVTIKIMNKIKDLQNIMLEKCKKKVKITSINSTDFERGHYHVK